MEKENDVFELMDHVLMLQREWVHPTSISKKCKMILLSREWGLGRMKKDLLEDFQVISKGWDYVPPVSEKKTETAIDGGEIKVLPSMFNAVDKNVKRNRLPWTISLKIHQLGKV